MPFAPKQDWQAYQAAVDNHPRRVEDRVDDSMKQWFVRYADYFDTVSRTS